MNDALLREIAEKIVNQQMLAGWPYLLVLLTLSILVGVFSIYASIVLRKRAETFASRSDLEEVLRQLRATTAAAEEVKAAISHSDWSARELKTLRRTKLEDLLLGVHQLQAWQAQERNFRVYKTASDPGPSPIGRISLLATLYFPELQLIAKKLANVHYSFHVSQLETEASILAAAGDKSLQSQAFESSSARAREFYAQHLEVVQELEKQSQDIMSRILGT